MKFKLPHQFTFLYFFCIVSSFNCQIRGSLKGLTSNRMELNKYNINIIGSNHHQCESSITLKNKIVIVDGIELKKCISDLSNVLVYIWRPNCKSSSCIELELLQSFCDKYTIELFIVAEYYDYNKMNKAYIIKRPIFGIDTYYYKTDFTKKYLTGFLRDLIHRDFTYKESQFYYFENAYFIKEMSQLEELN